MALQPIAFTLNFAAPLFRARQFVAQFCDLTLLVLDQIFWIIAGRRAVGHCIALCHIPEICTSTTFCSCAITRAHSLNEDRTPDGRRHDRAETSTFS